MGAPLGLITYSQLKGRTSIQRIKESDPALMSWYIEVAEGLLADQGLNTSKANFSVNMSYAVVKLVEHLVVTDEENTLVAVAGPFSEEKMGSYSYKLKSMEEQGWPPIVERIIKMYKSIGDPSKLVLTTRVFPEFKEDGTSGMRPYHDWMDHEFKRYEIADGNTYPKAVP